jgi:hypothetical protein
MQGEGAEFTHSGCQNLQLAALEEGDQAEMGEVGIVGMHEVVPYVVHIKEPESIAAETEAVVVLHVRTHKEEEWDKEAHGWPTILHRLDWLTWF